MHVFASPTSDEFIINRYSKVRSNISDLVEQIANLGECSMHEPKVKWLRDQFDRNAYILYEIPYIDDNNKRIMWLIDDLLDLTIKFMYKTIGLNELFVT